MAKKDPREDKRKQAKLDSEELRRQVKEELDRQMDKNEGIVEQGETSPAVDDVPVEMATVDAPQTLAERQQELRAQGLQDELAEYLIQTAVRSVDTENDRGHSIGSYSSRLLIGIAVLAIVALGVLVPSILFLAQGWQSVLMVVLFSGVLIPDLVAFLLAVTAGAHQADRVKGVPQDLFAHADATVTNKTELARRICAAEQERYDALSAHHDREAGALKAARILLLVSVGFFVVALGFLCVIMIINMA